MHSPGYGPVHVVAVKIGWHSRVKRPCPLSIVPGPPRRPPRCTSQAHLSRSSALSTFSPSLCFLSLHISLLFACSLFLHVSSPLSQVPLQPQCPFDSPVGFFTTKKPPTETQSHPRTLPPPTVTSGLITLLISAIAFSTLHHTPCLRPRSSPSRRSPPTTPRRTCTWSFTTRSTTAAASSMSTRTSLPLFSLLSESFSPREKLATGCFSYRESLPLSQSLTANLASSGLPLNPSPHPTINLTSG